jgi:hypothetical protein
MSDPLKFTAVDDIPVAVQELRSIFNTGKHDTNSYSLFLSNVSFNLKIIVLGNRLDEIIGLQKEAAAASCRSLA